MASSSRPRRATCRRCPSRGTPEHAQNEALGAAALQRGEVALVVLAGGMATRMGGVVKALVEAVDGLTFLDIRLRELDAVERRYGRRPPLLMMTSAATDGPIREALGDRARRRRRSACSSRASRCARRPRATCSATTTATRRSTRRAMATWSTRCATRACSGASSTDGGTTMMLANLDNLGATLDAAVVGWHLAHEAALSCEVVAAGGDRGGWPVRWNGRPVILEDFRLPPDFDPATSGVFNTNTFHADARALLEHDGEWTWFVVEKDVDGRTAIQRERLLGELTSHLDTRFVQVPRDGPRVALPAGEGPRRARRPPARAAGRAQGPRHPLVPLPRLLWLLSFVIMLDGRTMVTVLPDIAADLDVSVAAAGIAITAYLIPYGVCQLAWGPLADRVGPMRVIAVRDRRVHVHRRGLDAGRQPAGAGRASVSSRAASRPRSSRSRWSPWASWCRTSSGRRRSRTWSPPPPAVCWPAPRWAGS